jgi:serine/threonine protein kinase
MLNASVFLCTKLLPSLLRCCRRFVLADMGSAYKLKDHLDRVPFKEMGTPHYWPPEMVEGSTHHVGYDIYSLGMLLLECRSAQPPFVHLMDLPWEQRRLRRTYAELVERGEVSHLQPNELSLLQKCMHLDTAQRAHANDLVENEKYFANVTKDA